MWNPLDLFRKREKDPDKVRAGYLGGIASGEARRNRHLEKAIIGDILNSTPELSIVRAIGEKYDIELSDKELITLIPYLTGLKEILNDKDRFKKPIKYDL
ncbi:unnamed protein product [marine sediment metagenome]|uniref:Uncharacterized protein n=1 Tax=marine sediment metagenome TaxID=412755 RepID=X1LY31_9ZZZZ